MYVGYTYVRSWIGDAVCHSCMYVCILQHVCLYVCVCVCMYVYTRLCLSMYISRDRGNILKYNQHYTCTYMHEYMGRDRGTFQITVNTLPPFAFYHVSPRYSPYVCECVYLIICTYIYIYVSAFYHVSPRYSPYVCECLRFIHTYIHIYIHKRNHAVRCRSSTFVFPTTAQRCLRLAKVWTTHR
jgi:hypothetical protein